MSARLVWASCWVCLLISWCYAATVTATGTVRYEKRNISRNSTTAETNTYIALKDATVQASEGSTVLGTTTTDSNGAYTLSVTYTSSYTLTVLASSSNIQIGTGISGSTLSGQYNNTIVSNTTSAGPFTTDISKTENSGAYNIFMQLKRGVDWCASRNLTFTNTIKTVWLTTTTQFTPSNFTLHFLGSSSSSDTDEFDDDIILHEFGHVFAEEFSKDHSLGGAHSVSSQNDLRLSWSEGLAHFISSAIREDTLHVDSLTSTNNGITNTSSFNIATPSTAQSGTSNETAVAYVLWQAWLIDQTSTLSALTTFKSNLPTSISNDQITMDTFHDVWSGSSLTTHYTDRSFAYQTDSLANASSTSPQAISDTTNYSLSSLTFFPSGDKDYFSFSATSGDTFTINTSGTTNGALTSLVVYKGSVATANQVATNNQANGLNSDTTSLINLTASETNTFIAEVGRFTSTSANYGLGSSSSYTSTAGRYGGYTFALNKTGSGSTSTGTGSTSTTNSGLTSSSSSTEANSILGSLVTNTSTDFTRFADFSVTASTSGDVKSYNSGDSFVTAQNVAAGSTTVSHNDTSFQLALEGVTVGNTVVLATLPTTSTTNVPSGATGKIINIDMKNGSTSVTNGFSINLRLTGSYNSAKNQALYRRGSDGTFSDSGFTITNSGNDLIVTMTSFSTYVLVESDISTTSSLTSGGGGGGGCLLRRRTIR